MRWLLLPRPRRRPPRRRDPHAPRTAPPPSPPIPPPPARRPRSGSASAAACRRGSARPTALAAMGAHAHRGAAPDRARRQPQPGHARPACAPSSSTDGARQWLAAGRPDLARAALAEADTLTPPDADRRLLAARAAAAEADWPAAQRRARGAGRRRARQRAAPMRSSPPRCATRATRRRRSAEAERARAARPRPARGALRDRGRAGRDRRQRAAPPRLWLAADRGRIPTASSPPWPAPTCSASTEPRHRPGAGVAHRRVGVRRQPPRRRQRARASAGIADRVGDVAHEAVAPDPLDRRPAERLPEARVVERRQVRRAAGRELAPRPVARLARRRRELVPRAGRQAVVAAVDAVAEQRPQRPPSTGPSCSMVR